MIDWSHWHNEPYLVGGLVLLGWLWAIAAGPFRARLAGAAVPFPRGRAVMFYSALVIFYLAVGSPLDQIGERFLFSAHMLQHQILIYPALDATLTSGSMQTIDQPGLEIPEMKKVLDAYRGKFDIKDPLLSPLFAENAAQLPPALIITADIDALRDDGANFARKLQTAGVRARYINYLGMPHGFFFIPKICPPAFEGIAEITAELHSLART